MPSWKTSTPLLKSMVLKYVSIFITMTLDKEPKQETYPERHRKFINEVFTELRLPVYLVGGYAEDALLTGSMSPNRKDIDMVAFRDDKETVLQKLSEKGYVVTPVVIPPSQRPYKFKISLSDSQLSTDLVLLDRDTDGRQYLELVDTSSETPLKIYFDPDGFDTMSDVTLESIPVRCISPRALIQSKGIYAQIGSESEMREKDQLARKRLISTFFPEKEESDPFFLPRIIRSD